MPKPPYPAHLNVKSVVSVRILINEHGNVILAKAVSGHPLLRAASVKAASKAKFSPLYIGGKPVRVRTTIVYRFEKRL